MSSYTDLIYRAKDYYNSGDSLLKDIRSGDKVFDLEWCDGLEKEINLWTYWQGGNRESDNIRAEIVLVGQDFGCCKGKTAQPFVNDLLKSSAPATSRYVEEIKKSKKESYTDLNLIKLFASLGNEYCADIANPKLFFTNLCLGYRSIQDNSKGDLSKQMAHDCYYLKELIEILNPKVVICLGQSSYICALKGLLSDSEYNDHKEHIKEVSGSFNKAIDEKRNHIKIADATCCYEIFAMAHPGYQGTSNRKRYSKWKDSGQTGLEIMINDWQTIKSFLINKSE